MSTLRDWTPTANARPPEGQVVETIDNGGCMRRLIFERNLWWFEDRSMYVYFTPVFWRHW